MNIVIVLAGKSRRFLEANISTPKPALSHRGTSILALSIGSFPLLATTPKEQWYFGTRKEDKLEPLIHSIYGDVPNLVTFEKPTKGDLETAYLVASVVPMDEPLVILDCCAVYDGRALDFMQMPVNSMGIVVCPRDKWRNGPVVQRNSAGEVSGIHENGEGDQSLLGVYYFNTTKMFMDHAEFVLNNNYVSGHPPEPRLRMLPDLCAANKGLLITQEVTDVYSLETPDDWNVFRGANNP